MRFRPGMKTMVTSIAAAIAALAANAVYADSAEGADTVLGNWLNPGAGDTARDRDPEGLSPYRQPAASTPTGQLYDRPYLPREIRKLASGWEYSGYLEAGAWGGDANRKSALFREYKDPGSGLNLNIFGFEADKPAEARFVEIIGGGVGRDDQFYGAQFGRYNDYRVKLFYNETPHVFSTTAKPIWQGVGTGNLTLPAFPGIAAGGASATAATNAAAVQNLINATGEVTIGLVRKKGGASLDVKLSDAWKAFAGYSLEKREGTRPFGGGWNPGGNNGNGETVEPIDYQTHELLAGLRFADSLSHFNLTLSGSFFRNDIDALVWDNPFRVASGTLAIPRGRVDLAPNNDAYNGKLEYARMLPSFFNGRINATVAFGSMRQNDALLPPTITSGTGAAVAGGFNGNFNQWNTTDALGQKNANARIDTRLVDLGLSLFPADKLTVRGTLRHYETQNDTRYTAFNPLTGQIGYIGLDNASSVFNGTNNLHYKSIPFEYKKDNFGVSGEYQVRRQAVLTAAYEREEFHRAHRERDKTWEDRVKFGFTDRGFEAATLRLSYEYADRRGSRYHSDPYEEFYTASLPGYTDTVANVLNRIHTLEEMRKFDLADRKQHVLNGRMNYMLRTDLDLGVTAQYKLTDYPAEFGRIGRHTQDSFNLDLSYQPSAATQTYAFYSHQNAKLRQAEAADIGSAVAAGCAVLPPSCSDSFGAPRSIYPADRYWSAESRDRSDVLGLGLRHDFAKAKLDVEYTYTSFRSPLSYAYASAGALVAPTTAAQAGNAFPDLAYTLHALDTSLRVPISKRVALRFHYRYENGKLSDWHFSGLDQSTLVGNRIFLDAGPRNFRANMVGAFLQISL